MFLNDEKYVSTKNVSFRWNNIDLDPGTLAFKFNDEFDRQMFNLDTQESYSDDEIWEFKDPIILNLPSNWKRIQTQYKKTDKTTHKSVTYQSNTDLLTAIDCKCNDFQVTVQMLVYITKIFHACWCGR